LTYGKEYDIMEQLMKNIDEQNLLIGDYQTMIKIIQASLQRGAIQANECETVGRLYNKLTFMIEKQNKENENARLSETNN
tara:strand:+ start:667 stop:906 length:240 start_codon:yes stop_codon:yes gene_type:complete